MDPVSALGVASAAVQFLDFALQALSVCRQIRDDFQGATEANKALETYSSTLKDLSQELSVGTQSTNHAGRRIYKIAKDCVASTDELQAVLLQVRRAGNAKVTDQIKTTFRTMKDRKTIEKLQNVVRERRALLDTAIVQDIRNRVDLIAMQQSKEFSTLKATVQDLITKLQLEQAAAEQHRAHTEKDLSTIKDQNEQLSRTSAASQQKIDSLRQSVDSRFIALDEQNEQLSRASSASHSTTHRKIDSLHSGMDSQFSRLHLRDAREELLISLFYPEHAARREAVKPPFERTFDWIFDREAPPGSEPKDQSWSNFTTWLECSDSLYWITGKAGSGKSTLMAHIVSEQRTQWSLEKWAKGKPLHILSFFFWRPGSDLQKSTTGLLRSLAFQLFEEVPGLAEKVLQVYPLRSGRIASWTERKVRDILELGLQTAVDRRFCFFVDGLDEYKGQFDELVDLIIHLQDLSHVKFCASSRPEVEIKLRLSSYAQLRMEQLNSEDIEIFARGQLESHSSTERVLEQLTVRAQGVFLWAALASQSILRGIKADDNEDMLMNRLEQLPADLNDMFKQMLSNVDAVHKKSLGYFFRIMDLDKNPSVLLIATCLNNGKVTTYDILWKQCAHVESQILAQSRGLLTIDRQLFTPPTSISDESSQDLLEHRYWAVPETFLRSQAFPRRHEIVLARTLEDHGSVRELYSFWSDSSTVEWIHRSAYEFIFGSETELVHSCIEMPTKNEVALALIAAYIHSMVFGPGLTKEKRTQYNSPAVQLGELIHFIGYHRHIGYTNQASILDDISSLIFLFDTDEWRPPGIAPILASDSLDIKGRYRTGNFLPAQNFWYNCIEAELNDYVEMRLDRLISYDRDYWFLLGIIDHCIKKRDPTSLRTASVALRLAISKMEVALEAPRAQSLNPAGRKTRSKILTFGDTHARHRISWECIENIRLDGFRQEKILFKLACVHLRVLGCYEGPRVLSYDAEAVILLSQILTGLQGLFRLWQARVQHVLSFRVPMAAGEISLHLTIKPLALDQLSSAKRLGSFPSYMEATPSENDLEICYKRNGQASTLQPLLRDALEDLEVGSPSSLTGIHMKSIPCWSLEILHRYLLRLEKYAPHRWPLDFWVRVEKLLWENTNGELNAWEQLYGVVCTRIARNRAMETAKARDCWPMGEVLVADDSSLQEDQ